MLLCAWDLLPEPLLYLSACFEAHRQRYYDLLLAVSQQGAWEEWLRFFLRGVAVQARDAVIRARRLQDLRERYREEFQTARAAARLLQVVDLLFAQPVLTIGRMAEALGVSFPAARQYVSQLERAGVLREITGRARNRVYRAGEVLRTIEEPVNAMGDSASGKEQDRPSSIQRFWSASQWSKVRAWPSSSSLSHWLRTEEEILRNHSGLMPTRGGREVLRELDLDVV